jgi:hypothetical protein
MRSALLDLQQAAALHDTNNSHFRWDALARFLPLSGAHLLRAR